MYLNTNRAIHIKWWLALTVEALVYGKTRSLFVTSFKPLRSTSDTNPSPMHHLTLTYQGEEYVLHYAGTQVYYLRTSAGVVIDYDSIPPRLLELCQEAITYVS